MHFILLFITILFTRIIQSIAHGAKIEGPRMVFMGFHSKIPFRNPRQSESLNQGHHHDRLSSTPRSLLTHELQLAASSLESNSISYDRMSRYSETPPSPASTSGQEPYLHEFSEELVIDPDDLRAIFRSHPSESALAKAYMHFRNSGENPITLVEMRNWKINIHPHLLPNDPRTELFYKIQDKVEEYESEVPFTPDDLLNHMKILTDRTLSEVQFEDLKRKFQRFTPTYQSGVRFTRADYQDLISEMSREKPKVFNRIKSLLHHTILPSLV